MWNSFKTERKMDLKGNFALGYFVVRLLVIRFFRKIRKVDFIMLLWLLAGILVGVLLFRDNK